MQAVIPAAGTGSRMWPATAVVPKELLPVALKPLIQYSLEEADAAGIDEVVIVIRRDKDLIRRHLEALEHSRLLAGGFDHPSSSSRPSVLSTRVQFVEQDQPLGLAHAVLCARPLIGDEPFLVMLPDEIILSEEPVSGQLISAHRLFGGSVVAVRDVDPHEVERHGIAVVERNPDSRTAVRLKALIEKPKRQLAPSQVGVFGRYLLDPAVWRHIENTSPDSHGEIQLTDALNSLCATSDVRGQFFTGVHFDAGNPVGYFKANVELSCRNESMRESLADFCSEIDRSASTC